MDKNLIGTNAGIVWRIMSNKYCWTFKELQEQTKMSEAELWSAIGWLARESQIEFDSSAEEVCFYLNRIYF